MGEYSKDMEEEDGDEENGMTDEKKKMKLAAADLDEDIRDLDQQDRFEHLFNTRYEQDNLVMYPRYVEWVIWEWNVILFYGYTQLMTLLKTKSLFLIIFGV